MRPTGFLSYQGRVVKTIGMATVLPPFVAMTCHPQKNVEFVPKDKRFPIHGNSVLLLSHVELLKRLPGTFTMIFIAIT